ncbi:MAG: hypothetical protein HYX90_09125, partial [Chloroflexi bacterium]|nr:hypothetical protein [Chloroflexota bacterium]
MTNKVFLTALLAFLLVTGFLWALSALAPAPNSRARVIGFGEPVVMLTANGEKPIASRIDTGADSTSIDTDLALCGVGRGDGHRQAGFRAIEEDRNWTGRWP